MILDLANKEALEWLISYSSQLGSNIINNTLMKDLDGYIIGIKYNGVDTVKYDQNEFGEVEQSEDTLSTCVADCFSKINGFYLIGLDKKALLINKKIKYNFKNNNLYFKILKEYARKDFKALHNSINQLN